MLQRIFIAGCGYIGRRVAEKYAAEGGDVICMVRSQERSAELQTAGFRVQVSSLDELDDECVSGGSGSILFYLVPPPGGGTTDTRARNFIDSLGRNAPPAKIIYMSATSVYGGSGGVVTEESPAVPDSAMGKRRLDAEHAFREYGRAASVPVVILRVSGIYGPGRLPLMQISQGQPLLKEDESGPSNRIHADDLTEVCVAAAKLGEDGDIYNVSDGRPSSMTTYFNACADALGYPRQPQISLDEAHRVMSPLMLSYVTQSRIVDNRRMLERLHPTLRYPSLTEGLAASVPEKVPQKAQS